MSTERTGQKCEVCGATPDRAAGRRLEVHERWSYADHTGVQALRRLICLCNNCHLSTHLGFANVTGRADQALAHLQKVTGMTAAEVSRHVRAANDAWTTRSSRVWTLDLSILTDADVTLAQPEQAADRAAAAVRGLRDVQRPQRVSQVQPVRPEESPTPSVEAPEPEPSLRGRGWFRRLFR